MVRSRSTRKPVDPFGDVGITHTYVVTRIRREPVGRDPLGNTVDAETRTNIRVAGWAAPPGDEPKLAGHDRRVVQVELFAPVGAFQETDGVILEGETQVLEVIGRPGNYDHNPFGWCPGIEVVNLGGVE